MEDKEKITMKGVLDRNNELEEKLMEANKKRAELEERVQALENEKACLCTEIEALKVIPMLEEKASSLEFDVTRLREEKGALLRRVKELMVEKTPPPKEKPLEAYIAVPYSEDQSAGLETSITEPEVMATKAEAAPADNVDVATTEVKCEAAQAEAPVVEEKSCECLQAEPIASIAEPVEALSPVPTQAEKHSVEVPMREPEPVSLGESALVEPVIFESPAEALVIEEKPTLIPQVVTLIDMVVAPETSTLAKLDEAPLSEVGVIEEKVVEASQMSTDMAEVTAVEMSPTEVKLEEAIGTEQPHGETLAVEASPAEPIAEGAAVVESVEALSAEIAPDVTPPAPEKVEEQSIQEEKPE